MSDANVETPTKPKRARVSERAFIDAKGNEVDRMEQSAGARYTLVEAGKSFDWIFGANPEADKFFCNFGFQTKVGNVANTVLNDKDSPGTSQEAADEIDSFLEQVIGGIWREAGEGGGRTPKYDNAILAEALVALLGDKAHAGGADHYRARLDDPKGEVDSANKGYRAKVVARDDIKAEYKRIAKERGIAVGDTSAVDTLA